MAAAGVWVLAVTLAVVVMGSEAVSSDFNKDLPFRMRQLNNDSIVVPVRRRGEKEAGLPPWTQRIVDGTEAEPCQFPHQIAMLTDRGEFCGGSLINTRWVLTAAHCVITATSITVHLGHYEWGRAPHQIKAERIFIHGAYDPDVLNYDIALLDLGRDIPTTDCLRPVELERNGCGTSGLDGVIGDVSGWGLTGDKSNWVQSRLRWVKTRIISNDVCEAAYNSDVVIRSTLCSMPLDPSSSSGTLCNGDSGGPLLVASTGRQIGINSFVSIEGCEVGKPSGYARVPCFVDWIDYVTSL